MNKPLLNGLILALALATIIANGTELADQQSSIEKKNLRC